MADDGKQEPAPASPMLDDAEDSAAGSKRRRSVTSDTVNKDEPAHTFPKRQKPDATDPLNMSMLATYGYFTQWSTAGGERDETAQAPYQATWDMRLKYHAYCKAMLKKFAPEFARTHVSSPWFAARYEAPSNQRIVDSLAAGAAERREAWSNATADASLDVAKGEGFAEGMELMGVYAMIPFMDRNVDPDSTLVREPGKVQKLPDYLVLLDRQERLLEAVISLARYVERLFGAEGVDRVLEQLEENKAEETDRPAEQEQESSGETQVNSLGTEKAHPHVRKIDTVALYLWKVYRFDVFRLAFYSASNVPDYLWRRAPEQWVEAGEDRVDGVEEAIIKKRACLAADFEAYLERARMLTEPDSVDLAVYGYTTTEALVDAAVSKHVAFEDEGKYRCKVGDCAKLFMGSEFVEKHIRKKHSDFVEVTEKWANMLQNYFRDPGHVLPSEFRILDYTGNAVAFTAGNKFANMWPSSTFVPTGPRMGGANGHSSSKPPTGSSGRSHYARGRSHYDSHRQGTSGRPYYDLDAARKNTPEELDY